MELKQLRYFVELCGDMNIARAARRLYITPQGLAKSIYQLEEELQVPLLRANGRKKELTPYGQFLLDESTKILKTVDTMTMGLRHMYHFTDNQIVVNVSNTIRSTIPNSIFVEFAENFPHIKLEIENYGDMECEEKLLSGEIDAAVALGPLDCRKYTIAYLRDIPVSIMMHKSNRLAIKKKLILDDLLHEQLILPDKKYKNHHLFQDVARKHGLVFDYIKFAPDLVNICYYTQTDPRNVATMIGDLPKFYVDSSFCFVPLEDPRYRLKAYVVKSKARYPIPAIDIFFDFMKNYDLLHGSK